MALKVCAEPGCPILTDITRCPTHTRQRDRARGSSTARGYDKAHERRRAGNAPRVAARLVDCWRCGGRISPLDEWDEGHCDDDRTTYHGPEHVPCNRGARGPCPHISHVTLRGGG